MHVEGIVYELNDGMAVCCVVHQRNFLLANLNCTTIYNLAVSETTDSEAETFQSLL